MSARHSASREPSIITADSMSRRSSITSVRDIFSDDYALEPIDSNLNLSLADSDETEETLINYNYNTNFASYPVVPQQASANERTSSTFKSRTSGDGNNSRDTLLGRTLSTVSRLSVPRSQSPYNVPSRSDQPYAVYPQITRASSIASQSTFRLQERPFVHTGGPEHPYALYPQNTVVDEDEDIGTQPIPLGFSAVGYSSSRDPSSTEVGDIVLSDGHIEQLPPYTRYADNVVAKGDMARINNPHATELDTNSSERTMLINMDAGPPNPRRESNIGTEISEERPGKRTWREKAHKRVCGGSIAFWLLIMIVIAVVLASLLGGVIGGIVGRRQGVTEARQSGADAAVTTTVWVDAVSVSTDSATPTCPTGKYTIPFEQTQQISSCVADGQLMPAWGCLNIAFLGMTIGRDPANGSPNVRFDDYSVNPETFLYGPQPPDFNGTTISLAPHRDRDDQQNLGTAMFFYQEFDKLNILPSNTFDLVHKRSVYPRDVFRRGNAWDNDPLQIGDQPWFCFWNKTISEFWIFLEEPSNAANATLTTTSAISSSTADSMATSSNAQISSTQPWDPSFTGYKGSMVDSADKYRFTNSPQIHNYKRSYTAPYYPEYPRMIKMVEKRRADGNVKPYCQKMQVLNDRSIVPREQQEIIEIDELDWVDDPVPPKDRKRDTTSQLKSNCVCEWMSK